MVVQYGRKTYMTTTLGNFTSRRKPLTKYCEQLFK